jgi:hypothetical protein
VEFGKVFPPDPGHGGPSRFPRADRTGGKYFDDFGCESTDAVCVAVRSEALITERTLY